MTEQEFIQLLDKYLVGAANPKEKDLLFRFYERFQQRSEWNEAEMGVREERQLRLQQCIKAEIAARRKNRVIPVYLRRSLAVAAVLLLMAGGAMVWQGASKNAVPQSSAHATFLSPLQAGAVSAVTLTLENGTRIQLDKAQEGVVLQQGSLSLLKEANKLEYKRTGNGKPAGGMHQITTPKGAQFQVVLPDGSSAWLNAATAMRFPADFSAAERVVQVSGEVYFEVKKDASRPFRVYALAPAAQAKEGTMVEVLGTHFNFNAYPDEQGTRTTLLEGKVKVAPLEGEHFKNSPPTVLLPGQQALVIKESKKEKVEISNVDVQAAVAWKANLFDFNTADIRTIMRQLARWYDVEIVYESDIAPRSFSGKISRDAGLTTVLKILEQSNIRFKIKGKKIMVIS